MVVPCSGALCAVNRYGAQTAGAPFLEKGTLSPFAPLDRTNVVRSGRVDLGPIEVP